MVDVIETKAMLVEKVRAKERLTQAEGEMLYELDLYTLGELADAIRTEKFGKKSYFNINRHIPENLMRETEFVKNRLFIAQVRISGKSA